MRLHKTQIAAAVGAALLVGGTAVQAQNLTVQLYGQVNRAMMNVDDGTNNKWFFVDGQPSATRFGIMGSAQVMPGLRAGARFETELKSNASDVVTFATPSNTPAFAERWADISLEGSWGRVNLGQGSGAADDASTLDLSGTGIANGNCPSDWGGGIAWVTGAGVAIAGGGTVGNTFACNDFESRYDRVMYTTPTFGGFRAQAGIGQKSGGGQESTEGSLWYSGKLAGDFQAAIGYSNVNVSTSPITFDKETIGGSVSWLHTSGFNVTFSYTVVDSISATVSRESTFMWGKLGYKFGQHAIGVDYGIQEDNFLAGDEATSYGVGYVWNPIRWFELYAQYRIFQLDRGPVSGSAVSPEDVTVASIGTRIRF